MKELLKDLVKYAPSRLLPAVFSFISIPLLTNLFTPAEYGDYRLVLATTALLGNFVGWLSYGILRFYPEQERDNKLSSFYATTFWLSIASEVLFVVLAGLTLTLLRDVMADQLWRLMVLGVGLLVANSFFSTVASLVRSRREAGWFSVSVTTRSVLNLALGLLFIFAFDLGIWGFLLGTVIGSLIIIPIMWWRAARGIKISWREGINWLEAKSMFVYSFPIVLGLGATWALRLSDRYILEALRGSAEVGIYSASYGLADTSIGLIVALFQLPFVVLGNQVYENEGEKKAAEFVSDSARMFLLLAIPAVVGMSVLAKPLVHVMTGPEFIAGYRIVPFVATATLLSGLGGWYRTAFMFKKRTGIQVLAVGAGAAVNVGLNLILIPKYGYYAAGITTLLGFLTVNVLSYILGRRLFRWPLPVKSILKSLAASAVMALAVVAVREFSPFSSALTLVLATMVGVVVVAAMLFLLREFSRADLAKLRRFTQRSTVAEFPLEDG